MSVRVQLDKPHAFFTNLDIITGKIILNLFSQETISAVVVKLEGESRTRLASPALAPGQSYHEYGRDTYDRGQTELEVHKLLYKVATVFPSVELQQAAPRNSNFTLPPGQHEYPFRFKIPFNNSCLATNTVFTNLNVTGRRMEIAKDTNRHVKKTLPPSLSGFPGEAEIRYFVKVTVQRSAFYKENFRASSDFKFFPIEPPRIPANRRESYARRQHAFSPPVQIPPKPGLFRKQSTPTPATGPPPIVSIDGRLPDPAVITCNEPLPLRILVKKLNETPEILFLQLIQVELIGYTRIRAHQFARQEKGSWIIASLSHLQLPLGNSNTPTEREMEVDSKFWKQVPLPNTVAPTFETCNLSRHYELEIKVGLGYGTPGNLKQELTVLPLRMPVQVYSGIAPPPALLAEMARRADTHPLLQPPPQAAFGAPSTSQPPSPIPLSTASIPGASSSPNAVPPADDAEEAPPPSYEDAIAEDIGPVDGPRRDYQQPEVTRPVGNEKRNGRVRNDERLFP